MRCSHAAVGELQLRVVDRRLVGLDRALVLADERLLRVDLLLRDRVLGKQRAIALEIDLRVLEQRLVLRHLPLRLPELDLERPRVDLGQQVAGLHDLALLERDLHELPVDARFHDDHACAASPCRARSDRRRSMPLRAGAATTGMARADGSKRPPAAGAGGSAARVVRLTSIPAAAGDRGDRPPATHGQRRRRGRPAARRRGVTAGSERVSLGGIGSKETVTLMLDCRSIGAFVPRKL